MDLPSSLRSICNNESVKIRFINLTGRKVDIIWVNYAGVYMNYNSLWDGQYLDINTFKTHPWVAADSKTRDLMLIDNEFVFFPKTFIEYAAMFFPNRKYAVEPRLVIKVTYPVHKLRTKTLLIVRTFFKNPDDVDALDMPQEIIRDLKKSIQHRNRLPFSHNHNLS